MVVKENNNVGEAKIEPSVDSELQALIRAESDIYTARNMAPNLDNVGKKTYEIAITAIQKRQIKLIEQFPESLRTPEEIVKLYPALAERVGIQIDDK